MAHRGGAFVLVVLSAALGLSACPTAGGPLGPDRGPIADAGAQEDPCAADPCGDAPCLVDPDAPLGFSCGCPQGQHTGATGVCTSDPCDPDPCDRAAGFLCASTGEDARCSCNPAYFSEGADGACEPLVGGATLDPSSGVASTGGLVSGPLTVRVVDETDRPLPDVTVEVDGTAVVTGVQGEAAFAAVPLDGRAILRIAEPGALEVVRRVRPESVGDSRLVVRLLPAGATLRITAESGATLNTRGFSVTLPPSGFVSGPYDLYSGELDVTVTGRSASGIHGDSFPRELIGELAEGRRAIVPIAFVDVDVRTPAGNLIALAPLPGATLALPVGGTGLLEGETVPLWTFRADLEAWVPDATCTVVGEGGQARCVGRVHHFSTWLIARPTTTACVHVVPDLNMGTRYALRAFQLDLGRCYASAEGYDCVAGYALHLEGYEFRAVLPGNAPLYPLPSTCMLMPLDGPQGYRVAAQGLLEDHQTETTVAFAYFSPDVLLVDDLAAMGFGLTEMHAFEVDTELLCQNEVACAQAPLSMFLDELAQYLDADGDGFLAPSHLEALPLREEDCDDHSSATHPGAYDRPCDGVDADCDGRTDPYDALVPLDESIDPFVWNEALCRAFPVCALPEDEQTGNGFDENCDGHVADLDGDGYLVGVGPAGDCDDTNALIHPNALEVPGDDHDEDCDGSIADLDGDGFLANEHLDLIDATGLDYPDCDDSRAAANPLGDVAAEATFAAFYETLPNGVVRRRPELCLLFDETGQPRRGYFPYLFDANCDGRTTDLDGDGQAAPGDPTLGPGTDLDCDDLDPRVFGVRVFVPVDEPDGGFGPGATADGGQVVTCEDIEVDPSDGGDLDGGDLGGGDLDGGDLDGGDLDGGDLEAPHRVCGYWVVECGSIDPSLIDNSVADCTIDYAALGLEWSGRAEAASGVCAPLHGAETSCLPLLNTVHSVCAYDAWPVLFPPNPLGLGEPYGPCDFGAALPTCPVGTYCGGPALWTDTYILTLENALADLGTPANLDPTPDELRGLCFPACD